MVASAALFLAGCQGGPTYGTGVSSGEQLSNDLQSMFSLRSPEKEAIAYQPRPALVKPANTQNLPAPQTSVVETAGSQWPESPEQRRQRLRDEATANQDNPNYRSPIVPDVARAQATRSQRFEDQFGPSNSEARSQEFRRRIAAQQQGTPNQRRYLSEPPITYRQPSATAAQDDLGETESAKERRRKKEAGGGSGGWSLGNLIPGR